MSNLSGGEGSIFGFRGDKRVKVKEALYRGVPYFITKILHFCRVCNSAILLNIRKFPTPFH